MTKYTITRRDEETECSECGMPLYIGDDALMSTDEQSVYCSHACARYGEETKSLDPEKAETEVVYALKPGLARCKKILTGGHQCQLALGHVGRHAWEPSAVMRVAEIEAAEREAAMVKQQPKGKQAGCFDI